MSKRPSKKSVVVKRKTTQEGADGPYLLKLVMYAVIGMFWVRLVDEEISRQVPIPIGFLLGIYLASHEHFRVDRKIEYAVLVIAMLLGFWTMDGLVLSLLSS